MAASSSAPSYVSGSNSVALQFLTQLAAEVSSGMVDLPCFPDIVIRIRNTLSNPKTTTEQVVTVVGAEPQLAARLLNTANSAAFNQAGKPVTDLRSAVTRLGHALIQSAAMAFAVQQMKNEASLRPIAARMTTLWKHSITVASICQVVARKTKVPPDTAFLTGLLHGVGGLYVLVRSVGHPALLDARFQEDICGWHPSIGKAVLDSWKFPEEMSEAIGAQDENEPKRRRDADLSDILIVSIALAKVLAMAPPRRLSTSGIHAFEAISLTQEVSLSVLKHAHQQLGAIQDTLGR